MVKNVFKSNSGIFNLDLPKTCKYTYEEGIYNFHCKNITEGVLQISAYTNNHARNFDIKAKLKKEQTRYPNAKITLLKNHDAIHYGVSFPSDSIVEYYWIIGNKYARVFCSVSLNTSQSGTKIDQDYATYLDIVNSIKIFDKALN